MFPLDKKKTQLSVSFPGVSRIKLAAVCVYSLFLVAATQPILDVPVPFLRTHALDQSVDPLPGPRVDPFADGHHQCGF